jgi:hypothetical protein
MIEVNSPQFVDILQRLGIYWYISISRDFILGVQQAIHAAMI